MATTYYRYNPSVRFCNGIWNQSDEAFKLTNCEGVKEPYTKSPIPHIIGILLGVTRQISIKDSVHQTRMLTAEEA